MGKPPSFRNLFQKIITVTCGSSGTVKEKLDRLVELEEKTDEGLLADNAQVYGMESFALDHLKVLEGDLSKLYEPAGRYIAAVYSEDDYGDPIMDSHWAKLGDTVTLRYVEELEYYNPNTGEVYGSWVIFQIQTQMSGHHGLQNGGMLIIP